MIGRSKRTGPLPRLTIVILSASFAAQPLFPQSDLSPDLRPQQLAGPLRSVPVTDTSARPEVMVRGTTAIVSTDILRHPISGRARRMLQRALETMKSSNHQASIDQLLDTLAKYPDSAAYVHSLLGVEYLKTDRYRAAVSSFEQAVLLLPHDLVNRYNLGLSLVCAGDYERGEQEVRSAVELDPNNRDMQVLLNALLQRNRSTNYSREALQAR